MKTAKAASTGTTRSRLIHWAKSVGTAMTIWLALHTFVIAAFRIPSESMQNTLLVGDFLFVTPALYGAEVPFTRAHLPAIREPRRGEIVVFKSVEGDFDVVKRVVGVPGDTVAMSHGVLFRNGQAQSEPYALHADSLRSESAGERARMRSWQRPQ